MRCPSISLEGGLLSIKNSHLSGHSSILSEVLSSITITNRKSKALLNNSTFKENCFVVSNSAQILIIDSTFQSYRHELKSMIGAHYSIITLTGNVNFTEGFLGNKPSSGSAVYLWHSSLNISANSNVHFVNLTNNGQGGAVYITYGVLTIGIKTSVFFLHNSAYFDGGALHLDFGTLNVKPNASIQSIHNGCPSSHRGAVSLSYANVTIGTNVRIHFINNHSPNGNGGAVSLSYSNITVGTNASFLFYNNTAATGGAMYFYFGTLNINDHGVVNFSMNSAQIQGGAISIDGGEHCITLKKSSNLYFHSNSAFRGGAIYIVPSSFAIEVGINLSIEFVNNAAADVGGAVYAEMQSAAPCLFIVTDYSSKISFIKNIARNSIGQHMYGVVLEMLGVQQEYLL